MSCVDKATAIRNMMAVYVYIKFGFQTWYLVFGSKLEHHLLKHIAFQYWMIWLLKEKSTHGMQKRGYTLWCLKSTFAGA